MLPAFWLSLNHRSFFYPMVKLLTECFLHYCRFDRFSLPSEVLPSSTSLLESGRYPVKKIWNHVCMHCALRLLMYALNWDSDLKIIVNWGRKKEKKLLLAKWLRRVTLSSHQNVTDMCAYLITERTQAPFPTGMIKFQPISAKITTVSQDWTRLSSTWRHYTVCF